MEGFADTFAGAAVSVEPALSEVDGKSLEREFEERLADCSTLAFRVAFGVLHNRADAEDVAQEAALRAYRNFHRLRERPRFRAWLARIAWRLAIDRWRSLRRRAVREEQSTAWAPHQTVEDIAAGREFQAQLRRTLDELPEIHRQVLVLVSIEGHDPLEVARLLGVPEGTVKSRLFVARKKLAEKLRPVVRGNQ